MISAESLLAKDYKYKGDTGCLNANEVIMLNGMLLSPRGVYIHDSDRRKPSGFAVCRSCKRGICLKQMPKFAIANNYCFGTPPQCLTDLSEIELAMLTPGC